MEKVLDTPLNMTELAKEAGVSVSYVSHVAKGTKKMSLKLQFAIWGMGTTINGQPLTEWNDVFKQARIDAGLTLEALADLAGYKGKTSIIRIENGKTKKISPEKFCELCDILNIKGLPTNERNTIQNKPLTGRDNGSGVEVTDGSPVPRTKPQGEAEDGVGTSGGGDSAEVRERKNDVPEATGSDEISTEG